MTNIATVLLGLSTVVFLSLGVIVTTHMASAFSVPEAKIKAAQTLRQIAQNVQNSPNIPDSPKNEIVNKLNDRASQLDLSGGSG